MHNSGNTWQSCLQSLEASSDCAACVAQDLKFEIKHARHMGIHVSPTTAVNDVIFDSSSSWGLPEWKEVLDPLLG